MLRYASSAGVGFTRDRSSRDQAKLYQDKLPKLPTPSTSKFPETPIFFSQLGGAVAAPRSYCKKVYVAPRARRPGAPRCLTWPIGQDSRRRKQQSTPNPKKPQRPYWPATSGPHQALINKSGIGGGWELFMDRFVF